MPCICEKGRRCLSRWVKLQQVFRKTKAAVAESKDPSVVSLFVCLFLLLTPLSPPPPPLKSRDHSRLLQMRLGRCWENSVLHGVCVCACIRGGRILGPQHLPVIRRKQDVSIAGGVTMLAEWRSPAGDLCRGIWGLFSSRRSVWGMLSLPWLKIGGPYPYPSWLLPPKGPLCHHRRKKQSLPLTR